MNFYRRPGSVHIVVFTISLAIFHIFSPFEPSLDFQKYFNTKSVQPFSSFSFLAQ